MEEFIGGLWHRFITRAASRSYPEAAVRLADMEKTAGILFRAWGGDPGLRVVQAADSRHRIRRRLLQRIAGSGDKTAHAAVDGETLRLPPELALFPERQLNRDLYLWLIALAADTAAVTSPLVNLAPPGGGHPEPEVLWLMRNQQATLSVLARYPGLAERYQRLVAACIAIRMAPEALPVLEAAQENAIRAALRHPGSVSSLPPIPPKAREVQPVPLWLYPSPASLAQAAGVQAEDDAPEPASSDADAGPQQPAAKKRYAAERVDKPEGKSGLMLMFRAESLFSWGEYVKVDRQLDEDPNPHSADAAEDLDKLAITRGGKTTASKVRFDLDLPSAAEDDTPVGPGIALPEWDYKKRLLKADWCRLQVLEAQDAPATAIPPRLARAARRLRSQFAALAPSRRWLKSQPEGAELDVDACVRSQAERRAGFHGAESGQYLSQVRRERDMACLVLADLSLSTDAYVSNEQRVIDVIRDSLMLFSEALAATGDRFGLYGFSSLKRGQVRFHAIKDFDGRFDAAARGRIVALKPGYYTRMGAAIRHATSLLAKQPSALRLLLILSDGKPNDLDQYEGRYGIEDTRMALIEARKLGLQPFCVTIDREAASYLPHLFGPAGYTIIRKPEELPARLPLLYAQLTGDTHG